MDWCELPRGTVPRADNCCPLVPVLVTTRTLAMLVTWNRPMRMRSTGSDALSFQMETAGAEDLSNVVPSRIEMSDELRMLICPMWVAVGVIRVRS